MSVLPATLRLLLCLYVTILIVHCISGTKAVDEGPEDSKELADAEDSLSDEDLADLAGAAAADGNDEPADVSARPADWSASDSPDEGVTAIRTSLTHKTDFYKVE